MKFEIKYLALGLLFGFISCDVFMKGEMKEKSLGLLDGKGSSILGANEESIKNFINKKKIEVKEKIAKEEPYNHAKGLFTNNGNLLQKNIISGEEVLETKLLREQLESTRKEKIQKQQNKPKGMTKGSLNFLSGESGESKDIFESNEFYFTIDSDSRPKSDLQTVSGSNTILYDDEVEEESYNEYDEETILNNRYKSYLQGVKYNVDLAIKTISKIYSNYNSFATKRTRMYSTFLDPSAKARARENAKKFTKEKLEKNLNALLNYIQMSSNTAANLLYISEMHAKRKLDEIETKIKTLISSIKGQSDSYEAYKSIVGPILLIKDSLKEMQVVIDGNGVWY
ncbi:hypothetical protein SAMN02983004_01111 [Borreliella japonica]|uniref:Lipoprotein n=1 Tax=Borreliella japonica TaxID=34095 RepID=A0A1G4QGU3_BORJA|nr:ferrous iron transporter A [Borreliella japonica]SCW43732.1 hypothetical protein SAMN02983004_01111 [Borreliella japonica]